VTTSLPHAAPKSERYRGVTTALLGLAAVAWWVTRERMTGIDAGPGPDPGSVGFFVTAWTVMVAMMTPAITPTVARLGVPLHSTATIIAAYLGVWAAAGLVGYGVFALGRSLADGLFAWHAAGRAMAAAVLSPPPLTSSRRSSATALTAVASPRCVERIP
jgi:predicted metal-binding membrane protein